MLELLFIAKVCFTLADVVGKGFHSPVQRQKDFQTEVGVPGARIDFLKVVEPKQFGSVAVSISDNSDHA